jgi:hypothetical protein
MKETKKKKEKRNILVEFPYRHLLETDKFEDQEQNIETDHTDRTGSE